MVPSLLLVCLLLPSPSLPPGMAGIYQEPWHFIKSFGKKKKKMEKTKGLKAFYRFQQSSRLSGLATKPSALQLKLAKIRFTPLIFVSVPSPQKKKIQPSRSAPSLALCNCTALLGRMNVWEPFFLSDLWWQILTPKPQTLKFDWGDGLGVFRWK